MTYKSVRKLSIFAALLLIFNGCTFMDNEIEFTYLEPPDGQLRKFELRLDTTEKFDIQALHVYFSFIPDRKYSIPVIIVDGDSIALDRMLLTYRILDAEGKPIKGDMDILRSWKLNPAGNGTFNLTFTQNLKRRRAFTGTTWKKNRHEIFIPMNAFRFLPYGEHELQLVIDMRCYNPGTDYYSFSDTAFRDTILAETPLIHTKVRFIMNVPKLMKTDIIVKSVKINDHAFNKKWDFHLFGPGQPDPGYRIYYPSPHSFYESGLDYLFNSLKFRNTQYCMFDDTLELYHFSEKEYFTIEFIDCDDVGKSELINDYRINLEELIHHKGYMKIEHLKNIEFFELKAVNRF